MSGDGTAKRLSARWFEEELPGVHPDQVTKRGSRLILRRGFFYRHGSTDEGWREKVERALVAAGIGYRLVGYGEVDKPFRGGAPIQRQSHWWVEVELTEPQ